MDEFMKTLNFSSRENGRTPMQWDATANAGFTTGKPWKRVNDNYEQINVAAQEKDPNSILNHFRNMAKIRNENPVLVYGKYELLQKDHPEIYAFTRRLDDKKMLVLLNFSDKDASISLPEIAASRKVLINNYEAFENDGKNTTLAPYQAVVVEVKTEGETEY